MYRIFHAMFLMFILSSCEALTPDDPAATLQVERLGYVEEATAIAVAIASDGTRVMATAYAAETQVIDIEARNAGLLATLRAVIPPTQQIVDNSGPAVPNWIATPAPFGADIVGSNSVNVGSVDAGVVSSASGTSFMDMGTALTVRDTDGCAVSIVNQFQATVGRIYVTARAIDIRAGTELRVEWSYEGELGFTESFTVNANNPNFCFWFYIEPTDLVLTAGNWSVQLYANQQPILAPYAFTVGM